jgi:hypothetical protein
MAAPINLFNAQVNALTVTVNGGVQISIAATGPSLNWTAQQPTTNIPTFTGGNPAQNAFGYGKNKLSVTVANFPDTQELDVYIDPSVNLTALEIYMWWGTAQTVHWVALNAGVQIGMGTSVAIAGSKSAP